MLVIDTDILIWLLRGNREIKNRFLKALHEFKGDLFITPVQIAEIYAGLREKERDRTERFLKLFYIIEITEEIGKLAGEFMKKYSKSHGLTLADAFIGACTIKNNFKLWTLNRKHYPMINKGNFY